MNYLVQDYDFHPSFSFVQEPYSIDLNKLEEVNDYYQRLVSASYKEKSLIYKKTKANLESLIVYIFNDFKSQARDQYESQFLDELHHQCIRLLREELLVYKSSGVVEENCAENSNLRGLRESRFIFHNLSKSTVTKILDISSEPIKELKNRAAEGLTKREELSFNTGIFIPEIIKLLNREYKRDGVLQALSGYIGKSYQVSGLALELSVAKSTWWKNTLSSNEAPQTMYAHIDESIGHPKAIVYLSEVGVNNGPTSVYPGIYEAMKLNTLQEIIGRVLANVGSQSDSILNTYYDKAYHQSMSSQNFRKHFMRLPAALRFNSHLGWDILAGSDIEKQFLLAERKLLGSSGTNVVFDGANLFHRGGLIENGERLVLQVIFSEKRTIFQRIMTLIKRVSKKLGVILK